MSDLDDKFRFDDRVKTPAPDLGENRYRRLGRLTGRGPSRSPKPTARRITV